MHIIFVTAWIILLVVAIYWEFGDYGRMKKRKKIKDIKGAKEQLQNLKFLACFGYENTVRWRFIFIFSSVIALSIYLLIPKIIEDITSPSRTLIATVLFFISFITMYFGHAFRSFHFDRELCGKVKGDFVSF